MSTGRVKEYLVYRHLCGLTRNGNLKDLVRMRKLDEYDHIGRETHSQFVRGNGKSNQRGRECVLDWAEIEYRRVGRRRIGGIILGSFNGTKVRM